MNTLQNQEIVELEGYGSNVYINFQDKILYIEEAINFSFEEIEEIYKRIQLHKQQNLEESVSVVAQIYQDSEGEIYCYDKNGEDVDYPMNWPNEIEDIKEFARLWKLKIID